MRVLTIAFALLLGCGGKHAATSVPARVATVFPAARWVPANPTYVVAARTMRDAQKAFVDVVDTMGLTLGLEPKDASVMLQHVIGVDALNADAVGQIGVDLDGNVALFSDDVDPTFVAHLSSPQAMQAFFDGQRQKGLVTESVVVDGVEVFTAKLGDGVHLSWAVDKDWLWVHFGPTPETAWFEHSRHPTNTDWVGRWESAQKLAKKTAGLVGFVQLHDLMTKLSARVPEAIACAKLVEPVTGAGVVVESDGKFVGGQMAIELGGSAGAVGSKLMSPPPGWTAASANAPLSAQWNLDLKAMQGWFEPCAKTFRIDLARLDQFGVRSARAFVHKLDIDDKSGTGAIAFDLSHSKFFAQQLDQIPMRTRFEKKKMFGSYEGKHLSVPFVATVDYVLNDRVMIAAMGDGLLDKIGKGPAQGATPVFAIDVLPRGLPAADLEFLLDQAGAPSPKRLVERLQSWNDIHLGAHLDGDRIVVEAAGNRR